MEAQTIIKTQVDLHTHTIMSGHAYSTLKEMVDSAKEKELKIFGITEHGPAMKGTCCEIYFQNLRVIPRKYGEMTLMMGAEMNIMNERGDLDLPTAITGMLDIRIAGIHDRCFGSRRAEDRTRAICNTMKRVDVDIISHPVDGEEMLDADRLVKVSRDTGTLLELNNSSLRPERQKPYARKNFRELLEVCALQSLPIIMASDAHISYDVAFHSLAIELIKEIDFPLDLVLNLSPEKLTEHLKQTKERKASQHIIR